MLRDKNDTRYMIRCMELFSTVKGKLCKNLKVVQDLLQVMADEEVFPVSSSTADTNLSNYGQD
ncbi:hypothetical protein DFQ27_002734 [Actinomortierella ambigua]|uniref:Uncharacterized protein n=1 Tax=Actinomortierella ambigua TaxID=1343610 RepID=A0A9P6Q6P4_9FUNG|nr:hypothetical protein DFQ27_002734 [Actinomortierella ambigua]